MSVTELEKRNDFGVPSVQTLLDLLPLYVIIEESHLIANTENPKHWLCDHKPGIIKAIAHPKITILS